MTSRTPRQVALTIIAVASAMFILQWASQVFIPIVMGVLISYALEPVVRLLVRIRVPRALASAAVVLAVVGGVAFAGYTLSDDMSAVISRLPEAAQKLRRTVRAGRDEPGAIQQVQRAADELQKTAEEAAGSAPAAAGTRVVIQQPAMNFRQYVFWGSAGVLGFVAQAVLVTFFVFFLLASGDLFKRKIVRIAGPSLEKRRITVQILDEINRQIERLLLVTFFDGIIVGIATWIAFRAVGLEDPALWALMAGLFNAIPYFGPVIVSAATAVVAFVQFGTPAMAFSVGGIALAITTLEGWLIFPWLTSKASRTNEVAVFVCLIFWSFIWGIWGTLLAVPMLVVAKSCCDRIDDLKSIGELLGD